MTESVFVGTPLHDGTVNVLWARGALETVSQFRDRIRIETYRGSWLPRNRDALTRMFLDSGCSHFLCVDSDVAWRAEHLRALLAADREMVSGVYCRKQKDRGLPVELTGERDGDLWEAASVPAGLLLIARSVIERMVGAYHALQYTTGAQPPGRVWALWAPTFEAGSNYSGEDVAFCRRWRALGGRIWLHRGVVAGHVGDFEYLPDTE